MGGSHLIQNVKWWKLKWCWKTWVQEKMTFEYKLFKSLSLHVQELNCETFFNELEVHVGEEASLNLMPNLGFRRKILLASFLNHLLENVWIRFMFLYAHLPFLEEAKQNTIEITKETNAKLPHHKGHVLTYSLENKT